MHGHGDDKDVHFGTTTTTTTWGGRGDVDEKGGDDEDDNGHHSPTFIIGVVSQRGDTGGMAPNNQHKAVQAQTGGHLPTDRGDTIVAMTLSAIAGESWAGGTLSSLRKVGDNSG
jgi:hypothetical protein